MMMRTVRMKMKMNQKQERRRRKVRRWMTREEIPMHQTSLKKETPKEPTNSLLLREQLKL